MAPTRFLSDVIGIASGVLQLAIGGFKLQNGSAGLQVLNAAGNAYARVDGSTLGSDSGVVELNANATSTGANWKMSLSRPTTGMAAPVNYVLPAVPVAGNVLSTDVNGNMSFIPISQEDTEVKQAIAYNSSSPVAIVTVPAGYTIKRIQVKVVTAFDQTPTLSVGTSGTPGAYMATTQVDLKDAAGAVIYETNPIVTVGSATPVIATLVATGCTVGSAIIYITYVNV